MRATRGMLINKLLKARREHVNVLEGENVSMMPSLQELEGIYILHILIQFL